MGYSETPHWAAMVGTQSGDGATEEAKDAAACIHVPYAGVTSPNLLDKSLKTLCDVDTGGHTGQDCDGEPPTAHIGATLAALAPAGSCTLCFIGNWLLPLPS